MTTTKKAIDVVDAKTKRARNLAARDEAARVKAWTDKGGKGRRPATPNLDAVNHDAANPPAPPKRGRKAAPVKIAGVATSSGKLGMGELMPLVLDALAKAPGPVTASEVGKSLGRSPGAVHNVLQKLLVSKAAKQVEDRPRRYVATAAGKKQAA